MNCICAAIRGPLCLYGLISVIEAEALNYEILHLVFCLVVRAPFGSLLRPQIDLDLDVSLVIVSDTPALHQPSISVECKLSLESAIQVIYVPQGGIDQTFGALEVEGERCQVFVDECDPLAIVMHVRFDHFDVFCDL